MRGKEKFRWRRNIFVKIMPCSLEKKVLWVNVWKYSNSIRVKFIRITQIPCCVFWHCCLLSSHFPVQSWSSLLQQRSHCLSSIVGWKLISSQSMSCHPFIFPPPYPRPLFVLILKLKKKKKSISQALISFLCTPLLDDHSSQEHCQDTMLRCSYSLLFPLCL